jgi:hypothetical protein
VRDGNSFVLATQSPAKIHRISSSGEIIATAELPADPVALSSGPHGLLVGTEGPELLLRFDADLAETARREIELPSSVKVTFDGPVATKPISIAQNADRIAVITGDEAAAGALLFVSPDLKDQMLPSYFAEITSDLRDMRVSAGTTHSSFWGYKTNTFPASLYEFDSDRFHVFSGRDHDLVACASDVVVVADGLVIPNCDGDVVKIDIKDNRLSETSNFGRPRGFSAAASNRSTVRLFELEDALVAAIKKVSAGNESVQETHLSVLGDSNAHLPIKPFNATVVDLAALPDVGLVIFANPEGQRDTVALPF